MCQGQEGAIISGTGSTNILPPFLTSVYLPRSTRTCVSQTSIPGPSRGSHCPLVVNQSMPWGKGAIVPLTQEDTWDPASMQHASHLLSCIDAREVMFWGAVTFTGTHQFTFLFHTQMCIFIIPGTAATLTVAEKP